jgi:hypothetical protein
MNLLNKLLPSKAIGEDIDIKFNSIASIKPILLNELTLITPIKKKIFELRKKHKEITIERAQKKMSLIVPFRNREEHLKIFIPKITAYLNSQKIDYEIIIVEQDSATPFNRAKLMNIGVLHARKESEYFVFHDVDLIPQNIDYRYCNHSLKLFTYIEQDDTTNKKYKQTNFGGAVLIPKKIFYDINGFSNNYWQWGSEDDDFFVRHLLKGYIPLYDTKGQFKTLPHEHALKTNEYGKLTNNKKLIKKNKQLRDRNRKTLSKLKRGLTNQYHNGINNMHNYLIDSNTIINNVKIIKVSFQA